MLNNPLPPPIITEGAGGGGRVDASQRFAQTMPTQGNEKDTDLNIPKMTKIFKQQTTSSSKEDEISPKLQSTEG